MQTNLDALLGFSAKMNEIFSPNFRKPIVLIAAQFRSLLVSASYSVSIQVFRAERRLAICYFRCLFM